jgi:hypothetical protein
VLDVRIIQALDRVFVKSKPHALDRNLLSTQASCVPILRVLDYLIEADMIWCNSLSDQGVGGKVNARAIILVEDHLLEVPP